VAHGLFSVASSVSLDLFKGLRTLLIQAGYPKRVARNSSRDVRADSQPPYFREHTDRDFMLTPLQSVFVGPVDPDTTTLGLKVRCSSFELEAHDEFQVSIPSDSLVRL
jgi:hypothetical protein